jgi:hypothetical protein
MRILRSRFSILAVVYLLLVSAVFGIVLTPSQATTPPHKLGEHFDYHDNPILNNGHRESPRWCLFGHLKQYRLRVCLTLRHEAKWEPSLLPPFAGGIEKANSVAIGSYRLTNTFTHTTVVPWYVKMFVTNDSTVNTSQAPDHKTTDYECGSSAPVPCTRSTHELRSELDGFSWDYLLFPTYGGCGDFETYGDVGAAAWPHPHRSAFVVGSSSKGIMTGEVCGS